MESLFILPGLILLPVLAVKGKGYRGVYVACSIVGAILAWFFGQMQTERGDVESVMMAILAASLGVAIGGLLGAALYQAKKE